MTLLLAALFSGALSASVDPACAGETQRYAEEDQQRSFLLNYFALSTTFSPLHAPLPDTPGHGGLGLELAGIPPLSCERRLVLGSSKTEDTNKTPVAPRPRLSFVLPQAGPVIVYGSLGYVPPVTFLGTRNVITSLEAGLALPESPTGWQRSMRFHATLMKTVAELATPFSEDDPAYDDLYLGSTFGLDLMAGRRFGAVIPYLALGFTDVSTFFYIGDDGVVQNNPAPFAGFVGSLGAQAELPSLLLAAELYTAPGQIVTARAAITWRI